jgi:hypothetical protein
MSENGDSVRYGNVLRFLIAPRAETKPLLLERNADVSTALRYLGTAVLSPMGTIGRPRTAASKIWISQDLDLSVHIPEHSLRKRRLYYEDYSLLGVRLVAR